jgi:hypothetical protein
MECLDKVYALHRPFAVPLPPTISKLRVTASMVF